MATPSRYQKVEERNKVSSRVEWKTDPVAGSTNRDYSNTEPQKKINERNRKVSDVINNINKIIAESSDAITKIRCLDDIFDINKRATDILNRVQTNLANEKDWPKAMKIYNEEFIHISSEVQVKGALSKSEIKNLIKNRSFKKACDRFKTLFEYADKIKKGCDFAERAVVYYTMLRNKISRECGDTNNSGKVNYSQNISESAKMRDEMKSAKENMDFVIQICKDMSELAPPGVREYMEFNFSVFLAVDDAMGIVDKHSLKIEELLNEIDKLFKEINESTSIKAGDSSGFDDKYKRLNDSDLNRALDIRLGRK